MSSNLRLLTAYLMMLSLVGMVLVDIFLPGLPLIAESLDTSLGGVQSIFSVYFVGVALAQAICGPMADIYGRRPVILSALTLIFFGSAISAISSELLLMLFGRFCQGMGSGVTIVLWRTLAFDKLPTDQAFKMLATVLPIMVISPAVAPLIGGALTFWLGWQSTFVLTGLLGASAFAFTVTFLKENAVSRTESKDIVLYLSAYLKILLHRKSLIFFLMVCTAYSTYFAFLFQSALIYDDLGFGTQQISFLYLPIAVFFYLGSVLAKRLSKDFEIQNVLLIGVTIFLLGTISMSIYCLFSDSIYVFYILILFCAVLVGNALILSSGMALIMSLFPENRATSSALIGLSQSLATAFLAFGLSSLNHIATVSQSLGCILGFAVLSMAGATAVFLTNFPRLVR